MNDLISRQTAIRKYQEVCYGIECSRCPFLIQINTEKESHLIADCKLEAFLHNLPSAQSEIIRCKECKYYEIAWLKKDGTDDMRYKPSICVRGQYGITRNPDWYCADAERKGEQDA